MCAVVSEPLPRRTLQDAVDDHLEKLLKHVFVKGYEAPDDIMDLFDDDEPAFCDHFCADDICRNMGECAWRDTDDDERN